MSDWTTAVNAEVVKVLAGLVKDGILSAADAAKRANVTESEFLKRANLK